ncbi:MAG TPA: DnaD domain protein [Aggregatilineales bacterium]|nr:DnaD domain protein [Aggregatilineales bacterium]
MSGFPGFLDGKQSMIAIPGQFFSELLPKIDNLIELQVTLYCFWALYAQESKFRYVRFTEVCTDEILVDNLRAYHNDPVRALREGFERTVSRGTLLHVHLTLENGKEEDIYFMNTPKGREALEAIEAGDWIPGGDLRPIALVIERPNIYAVYEDNFGAITPMISDALRDIEKSYPHRWINEALRMAALNQVRSLSYVTAILERWRTQGRESKDTDFNSQDDKAFLDYLRQKYVQD